MNHENFFRQVLPNGMTVIFEKRDVPLLAVTAGVKFGSGYETVKLKGLAHFIEHTVFKGTKRRTSQQISSEIEKKGGVINAYTGEELTAFWIKLRAKHIENAIDILADIMLNPAFAKKDIDTERKAVLEEIKMWHDNPQLYILAKLKEQLFPAPLGWSPLGTDKIIKKTGKLAIAKYHNLNYTPQNMILSVVGNAQVDAIWNLSKKYFSKGLIQKQITSQNLITHGGAFGKLTEKRKGIDQSQVSLGFHVPSNSTNQRYAVEVFNTALGVGMSSKLFQEVREKRGLAYNIGSDIDSGKNYGYCAVTAGIPKGKSEIVRKMILEEIKKLKDWNQKELDEAKEELFGHKDLENERIDRVADSLLREQMLGDAKEYYKYEEKVKAVTLEDIKNIADIKDYAFVALVPE